MNFTPVGNDIRFGLVAIKNVGENTARAICAARENHGCFLNLFDFCEAIEPGQLNRRVLESLIKAGALDCLQAPRAALTAAIDKALTHGQRQGHHAAVGQGGLFAGRQVSPDLAPDELPQVDEWPEDQLLAGEYATLGFYVSGHPLAKYAGRLKEMSVTDLGALEGKRNNEDVFVAGIIAGIRPMRSRKGARWAILTLQDMTGMAELLVFPEAFSRHEMLLKSGAALVVKGRISVEEVGTRVIVSEAKPLEAIGEGSGGGLVRIHVEAEALDDMTLDNLKALFSSHAGPYPVVFEMSLADGTAGTLQSQCRVGPDAALVAAIEVILGAGCVEVVGGSSPASSATGAKENGSAKAQLADGPRSPQAAAAGAPLRGHG